MLHRVAGRLGLSRERFFGNLAKSQEERVRRHQGGNHQLHHLGLHRYLGPSSAE